MSITTTTTTTTTTSVPPRPRMTTFTPRTEPSASNPRWIRMPQTLPFTPKAPTPFASGRATSQLPSSAPAPLRRSRSR
ncbi:uncharacterized protein B0T23DRAFT_417704 [Neurospora hispaniola]|uniref:Uncharacterized protein n=1 Tax=Neurospora hispaniola TaxID=588809 RepID=A0AAJ0IHB8_9PEZI|nr:hypothetical protein B0T23DRAFT_417704 [Neurospora hispaniola]